MAVAILLETPFPAANELKEMVRLNSIHTMEMATMR